ncbi:unnamed protein product [Mytilus edulis]|uniref:Uncharacterized protein n=1 Tax=Mytilus edulis TaxID=6550 RepID=A0A8S3QVF3_MYTED|nr:unnamed protein product [Mytilus edulis]
MRKSQKDKSINKQHKAELCSTFKRITSLEKLDYALKNLWESGIFTEEVHNNLNKWWTTGVVDTTDNQNLSQVDIKDAEKKRPHILMNISTKSLTLTVEQSDANSSHVSYDFPFSDECVPLKTMATIVHQTTIHKPSSDSYQKVTAEKYLTDSPKPDACPADNQINLIIIPSEALRVLNTYFPCDIYPDSQAILENDIKHQHEMSSQELALCSIHFDQQTFSTNQFSQWNQNIAIFGQPGHILCSPNQSTTNLNDISSATKTLKILIFTCKSPQQQSETTSHRKIDSSMDNSTTCKKDMELLLDYLDIDLDSFDIDDQTFDVEMNARGNENKNLQVCDKDRNLMNDEIQMSNKNTTVSAYDTNVSSDLEMFLQEMICGESEKMIQMKSYLSDV